MKNTSLLIVLLTGFVFITFVIEGESLTFLLKYSDKISNKWSLFFPLLNVEIWLANREIAILSYGPYYQSKYFFSDST